MGQVQNYETGWTGKRNTSESKMECLNKEEWTLVGLVHHDHEGKPLKDAANEMGIKPDKARRLLASAEDKAPSFFPIFTDRQLKILHMFTVESLTAVDIATEMDISVNTVKTHIRRLRNKGFLRDGHNLCRCTSFDGATMEAEVKQKW